MSTLESVLSFLIRNHIKSHYAHTTAKLTLRGARQHNHHRRRSLLGFALVSYVVKLFENELTLGRIFREGTMNKSMVQTKIETYHDFIEGKLKEDLKQTQLLLERLQEEKQHWMDAKLNFKMLKKFKESCPQQDLYMDIPLADWDNKSIIASTTVTNLDNVHIDIGCGVQVTMELHEADKYADIRIKTIERHIKHYMDTAVAIKVHIKVTLLAVNELIESEK